MLYALVLYDTVKVNLGCDEFNIRYEFRHEQEQDYTSLHSFYRDQRLLFVSSFKIVLTLSEYPFCATYFKWFEIKYEVKIVLQMHLHRGEITTGIFLLYRCGLYLRQIQPTLGNEGPKLARR